MPRSCDSCGKRYEPLRATSRYCEPKCRIRAHRSGVARPAKQKANGPTPRNASGLGTLAAAVLAELKEAEKDATALGQSCLALAQRIDGGEGESGSAIAALNRELRASLESALKVTAVSGDILDEMARKREERLRRAGG